MHSGLCEFALCLIAECMLLLDLFAVLACEHSSFARAQQHKTLSVHAEYEESASVDDDTIQLMADMF